MCAKLLPLCLTLRDPMDCSLPGSFPWDSPSKNTGLGCHALLRGFFPGPGIEPESLMSPALAGGFFTTSTTWEAPRLFIISVNSLISHLATYCYAPWDNYIHLWPFNDITQGILIGNNSGQEAIYVN